MKSINFDVYELYIYIDIIYIYYKLIYIKCIIYINHIIYNIWASKINIQANIHINKEKIGLGKGLGGKGDFLFYFIFFFDIAACNMMVSNHISHGITNQAEIHRNGHQECCFFV